MSIDPKTGALSFNARFDAADYVLRPDPDQLTPVAAAIAECIKNVGSGLYTGTQIVCESLKTGDSNVISFYAPWDPTVYFTPEAYLKYLATKLPADWYPLYPAGAPKTPVSYSALAREQVQKYYTAYQCGQIGATTAARWKGLVYRGNAPSPAVAYGASELWDRAQVDAWAAGPREDPPVMIGDKKYYGSNLCAQKAGVARNTFLAYVARGQAPAAVMKSPRGNLWAAGEIDEWLALRPGRGARTDLL